MIRVICWLLDQGYDKGEALIAKLKALGLTIFTGYKHKANYSPSNGWTVSEQWWRSQ